MKRIARTSLIGLSLVLCLAITGALYEAIGRWRDTRRFPERGHLVQVGSIRMNIDCSGQGSPTVVLESDVPTQFHVFSFVHNTHAPIAQLLDDAVVRNGLPDH